MRTTTSHLHHGLEGDLLGSQATALYEKAMIYDVLEFKE